MPLSRPHWQAVVYRGHNGDTRIRSLHRDQLLNAAESLKWWRLEDAPHHAFKLVGLKLNQVVKRVSNSLALKSHGDTAYTRNNSAQSANSISLPVIPAVSRRQVLLANSDYDDRQRHDKTFARQNVIQVRYAVGRHTTGSPIPRKHLCLQCEATTAVSAVNQRIVAGVRSWRVTPQVTPHSAVELRKPATDRAL